MPVNPKQALKKYRRNAPTYDHDYTYGKAEMLRQKTISLLHLKPGNVVLDVACGTGLSFPLIMQAIGPDGRLIGIEMSPEMLAIAHEKVNRQGWTNATLV
jgi:ubiquinone/menaquinone biosynthesis C-methylase UbiE